MINRVIKCYAMGKTARAVRDAYNELNDWLMRKISRRDSDFMDEVMDAIKKMKKPVDEYFKLARKAMGELGPYEDFYSKENTSRVAVILDPVEGSAKAILGEVARDISRIAYVPVTMPDVDMSLFADAGSITPTERRALIRRYVDGVPDALDDVEAMVEQARGTDHLLTFVRTFSIFLRDIQRSIERNPSTVYVSKAVLGYYMKIELVYSRHLGQMTTDLKRIRAKVGQELQTDLRALLRQIHNVRTQGIGYERQVIDNLLEEYRKLKNDVKTEAERYDELHTELKTLQRNLEHANGRIVRARNQIARLQDEQTQLDSERKTLEVRLNTQREHRDKVFLDYDDCGAGWTYQRCSIVNVKQEFRRLNPKLFNEIEATERELRSNRRRLGELPNEIRAWQDKKRSATARSRSLEQKIGTKQLELAAQKDTVFDAYVKVQDHVSDTSLFELLTRNQVDDAKLAALQRRLKTILTEVNQ